MVEKKDLKLVGYCPFEASLIIEVISMKKIDEKMSNEIKERGHRVRLIRNAMRYSTRKFDLKTCLTLLFMRKL